MEFEKDRENDLRVVWQAGTPSTAALFESLVFRQFSQTDRVSQPTEQALSRKMSRMSWGVHNKAVFSILLLSLSHTN